MQRACVSHDEVVSMVERLYGVYVSHFSALNSYDDVNLHVRVKNIWDNKNISAVSSDGYVLKILNSLDSTKHKFIGKKMVFKIVNLNDKMLNVKFVRVTCIMRISYSDKFCI